LLGSTKWLERGWVAALSVAVLALAVHTLDPRGFEDLEDEPSQVRDPAAEQRLRELVESLGLAHTSVFTVSWTESPGGQARATASVVLVSSRGSGASAESRHDASRVALAIFNELPGRRADRVRVEVHSEQRDGSLALEPTASLELARRWLPRDPSRLTADEVWRLARRRGRVSYATRAP